MSKKLLKSTSIFSGMTLLSRVVGFVRDLILAQIFGAGLAFDSFAVAFRLPNFFRQLFGEGAFSQAFVPVLSEYSEKRSKEEVQHFLNHIAGVLSLILFLVVALFELCAPFIVMIFAPGFIEHPEKIHLTSQLLRVTSPYLLFISLTAFSGAILNTFGRFAIPAFSPTLLNLAMIMAAVFFSRYFHPQIMVLAWGVFAGGIAQLAVQLPAVKKLGLFPKLRLNFSDPGVRRVLKLMLPALFGVSVSQLSLFLDNFFASFLPTGSISWLYYSNRLTYFPLGLIGVALATVVLPQLSRDRAKASVTSFSDTLDWALKIAFMVGFPAMIGLFMLASPILATLMEHGKFNRFDVMMSARSLVTFSLGLPGFMAVKVLASGFYSHQNIKTPVKVAAAAMMVNFIFNIILIFPLKHAGLALSTSISSAVNAGCLGYFLIKQKIYQPKMHWKKFILQLLIASIVMIAFLFFATPPVAQWLHWGIFSRVWHLGFLISVAFILYVAFLWIVGIRVKDFKA